MKLNPVMPQFMAATIRLGDEIAGELIGAARSVRPRWTKLFDEHHDFVPKIRQFVMQGRHCVRHPLVHAFMATWAEGVRWGVCDSGCWDAIGINVPQSHLDDLARFGGVEGFEIMLGDGASHCCAILGNNDHDRRFGLIMNCPAWIELASYPEYQDTFEKQLRMVIQHEMAHFLHQGGNQRTETHAHCRGIATAFRDMPMPSDREDFLALIQSDHPEISNNQEMRDLVLQGGEASWRLVRRWINNFKRHDTQPAQILRRGV